MSADLGLHGKDYWSFSFVPLLGECVTFDGCDRIMSDVVKDVIRQVFNGKEGILDLEGAFALLYECHEIVRQRTSQQLAVETEKFTEQEAKVTRLQQIYYRIDQK